MARMFTKALTEQGIEVCNADAAHLDRAKNLSGVVVLRALDAPGGTDVMITYTFDGGRCTDYVFEEEPAPSSLRDRPFVQMKDGLARITAGYDTFVKLDKGEIEPADAINSPDYQIDGNLVFILPYMQAVDSWTNKIRELEKEY